MSERYLSWLAWSLCALTLLVLASSLVLILLGWSTPLPQGATPWRDRTLSLVGIVGAPILGGLIASRRPRNPYGWLWLGFGLGRRFELRAALDGKQDDATRARLSVAAHRRQPEEQDNEIGSLIAPTLQSDSQKVNTSANHALACRREATGETKKLKCYESLA